MCSTRLLTDAPGTSTQKSVLKYKVLQHSPDWNFKQFDLLILQQCSVAEPRKILGKCFALFHNIVNKLNMLLQ